MMTVTRTREGGVEPNLGKKMAEPNLGKKKPTVCILLPIHLCIYMYMYLHTDT